MWFGIRISSPIHLTTLTIPIQNKKCLKNASKDNTYFIFVILFITGQFTHCNGCFFHFFQNGKKVFSPQCSPHGHWSRSAPCQSKRERTSWDRSEFTSQNLCCSKSYLSIAWSAPSRSTSWSSLVRSCRRVWGRGEKRRAFKIPQIPKKWLFSA